MNERHTYTTVHIYYICFSPMRSVAMEAAKKLQLGKLIPANLDRITLSMRRVW